MSDASRYVNPAWYGPLLVCAHIQGDDAEVKRLQAEMRETEPPGLIYCIGGEDGPVKIGWTGNWGPSGARNRLLTLQSGNPVKLSVLAETYGSRDDERDMHRRLWKCRVRGEWFDREPALALFEVDA